jgi:NodT family efflux transporter outer membrane factor (OMF) lipoprotein
VPETWKGDSRALEPWLASFDDATLEALITQGLGANHNLRQAALRMRRAHQQARAAGSARWPSINGRLDGSRTERNRGLVEGISTTATEDYGFSLDMSWELDLWGKLIDRQYAAESEWEATKEDFAAARLSLAGRIAQAWYNAVTGKEQIRIAREALHSSKNSLATIDDLYLGGLNSALDVRLSRANVETARENLLLRELNADRSLRHLEVLIGDYPAGKRSAKGGILPELKTPIPTGLPSELITRRPDLRAATRRLVAAGYRIDEAEKEYLPAIRLTGRGGTSTDAFSDILNQDFRFSNVAAGLTQPFFRGRQLKAGLAVARTDQDLALVGLYDTALRAFQEVENAISAEQNLRQQAAALGKVNLEYSEAEKLAMEQYEDGLVDILTVLDAQRRYVQSQQQLMAIQNQIVQNRIDLVLALGGDFIAGPENEKDGSVTPPDDKPHTEQTIQQSTIPSLPIPAALIPYRKPSLPLIPKNLLQRPVEQP